MPPEVADVKPAAESSTAAAVPAHQGGGAEAQNSDIHGFSDAEYLHWRKTGESPQRQAQPQKEDSTPSKETSATDVDDEAAEKTAPDPESGKPEPEPKSRNTAENRLKEILADLKRAGLTPAELKSYKREAAKAAQTNAEPSPAAPKPEAKPAPKLDAPVKPKLDDKNPDGSAKYKTYEEFEDAKDQYHEAVAEHKKREAIEEFKRETATQARQQVIQQQVTEARKQYTDFDAVAGPVLTQVINDAEVPLAVKETINRSPVLAHLLYAIGGDPTRLEKLIHAAKSDPLDAIRQVSVYEYLVMEEMNKGKNADEGTKAADGKANEVVRNDKGQFESPAGKGPEKKITNAPPPPKEANTKGAPPPDEVESAVDNDDFDGYRAAQNRRDLARRKG